MISLGIVFNILVVIFGTDLIPKHTEWVFDLAKQLPFLNSYSNFFEKSKFNLRRNIYFYLFIYITRNYRFL